MNKRLKTAKGGKKEKGGGGRTSSFLNCEKKKKGAALNKNVASKRGEWMISSGRGGKKPTQDGGKSWFHLWKRKRRKEGKPGEAKVFFLLFAGEGGKRRGDRWGAAGEGGVFGERKKGLLGKSRKKNRGRGIVVHT